MKTNDATKIVTYRFPNRCDSFSRRVVRRTFALVLLVTPLSITTLQGTAARSQPVNIAEQRSRSKRLDAAQRLLARAGQNGDSSLYPQIDALLASNDASSLSNVRTLTLRAGLALARHEFAQAKQAAIAARRLEPENFDARAALIDADIELGNYKSAKHEIDLLVTQRPGFAGLARLSYFQQLHGDLVGAEASMRSAIASTAEGTPTSAVAHAYLGDILLERGREAGARLAYVRAHTVLPTSSVAAIGIARLDALSGQPSTSKQMLATLAEQLPTPGVFGELAEIARFTKDTQGEKIANAQLDASIKLLAANGGVVDAELAMLLADRGPSSAQSALVAAKTAYAERQTLFTSDAMAWALIQANRPEEAEPYAIRAIATNPAVASIRWHAAVIFAARNKPALARQNLQLAIGNRWFSLSQRSAVERLAAKLGVGQ